MNKITQITQDELIQLIAEKLTADGLEVIPSQYTVQFVTSADGKTSALVAGIVKEKVQPDRLVPIPAPPGGYPVRPAKEELPAGLERSTRIALQVVLTFKPQTQEKLTKKVLETLMREVPAEDAVPSSQMKRQVNALVITALQAWVEEGKLVYVEEIDSWHKARAPKTSAAQAASDILGGTGGAMGRGDALGAGVGND